MSNENARIQRLLALLSIGVVEALRNNTISADESERLLFSPRMMNFCQRISAKKELRQLIHLGTELDDIKRLVSEESFIKALDEVRQKAEATLRDTTPSDSQLDFWAPRLID